MGTIQPGYISTQGFSASMSHKYTSLAIQQATYWSQIMGTIQPGYISTKGFSALQDLRENIFNAVKLSPQMFYKVIEVCRMI